MALIYCKCCGREVSENASACPHCGEPLTPSCQQDKTVFPLGDDLPVAATKWNWGAFFFSWLWGIFNGVYWPLLILVVGWIPYLGGLASLAMSIFLGIKGGEYAWKGRQWSSEEQFASTQNNWAIAALIVFILSVLGIIAIGSIIGIAAITEEFCYAY